MLTLTVKQRDTKVSTDDLRKQGSVPAVFYGPKETSTPIATNAMELSKIFREAGETTIVKLTGIGEDKDTLIHDVQFHPVTGQMLHADFYVLEKGKKITISVPLEFTGSAPAEKLGHIVVKAMHELEIEVVPAELPHHLTVDVSKLEQLSDRILAQDVALPPSATLKTDPEEIVVAITEAAKEEVAPAPAADAAAAAPVKDEKAGGKSA